MIKIDDDFCERFVKSLPEQQWGVSKDGQPCGVTEHWIGLMIDQAKKDKRCERFNALLKANFGVLREYALKAGQMAGFDIVESKVLLVELIGMFCFNVMNAAHLEATGEQRVENTQWGPDEGLDEGSAQTDTDGVG